MSRRLSHVVGFDDAPFGRAQRSRFRAQLHAVLLQGIAFAGFNVVDLGALHELLALPVLAVARRKPDLAKIRRALLEQVPGGARNGRLPEPLRAAHLIAGGVVAGESRHRA